MHTNDPIQALENVNKDYLNVLYSKEYRMGKRVYKLKNALKHFNIKALIEFWKSMRIQKKVSKMSYTVSSNDTVYANDIESCIDAGEGVVYTCVTGGYDNPGDPIFVNTDFVFFTDKVDENNNNSAWIKRQVNQEGLKGNQINRYYKMHPWKVLENYRFSVYIDGNVQVVSDIRPLYKVAMDSKCGIAMHTHPGRHCAYVEARACILSKRGNPELIEKQMSRYREEGFPEDFGFCEATIIVVDNNNPVSKLIMENWWQEFLASGSGRDQIAFPYVVWKCGYKMDDIGVLGNNLLFNPKFRIINLGDHKFKKG